MIDFSNGLLFKLRPADARELLPKIKPLLIPGEQALAGFQGIRDFVVFTNKRIIAVNVQGMRGRKKDFTSMPYSRISAFSVETAGDVDLDTELQLWIAGLGEVKLEFLANCDIQEIGQIIATYVL